MLGYFIKFENGKYFGTDKSKIITVSKELALKYTTVFSAKSIYYHYKDEFINFGKAYIVNRNDEWVCEL